MALADSSSLRLIRATIVGLLLDMEGWLYQGRSAHVGLPDGLVGEDTNASILGTQSDGQTIDVPIITLVSDCHHTD